MSNNQQTETTNETIDQNLETETTQNEDQVTDFNESTKEVTVTPEEPVKEEVPEKPEDAVIEESIPSMEQFEDQIDKSFRKVNVGDIVKGSVVGVSDTEVIMDIGSYAEGLIRITDYSNDPNFSIKEGMEKGGTVKKIDNKYYFETYGKKNNNDKYDTWYIVRELKEFELKSYLIAKYNSEFKNIIRL